MVRITDLVSRLRQGRHEPEKIKFQTPRKKIQTNSGFLDGFWALCDDSGPEGSRLGHSE